MSVNIKICGLKDRGTVRQLDGLAVDEVGFIFAKSRRQVAPELAAELIDEAKRLRNAAGRRPRTVGVFVNPGLEELRSLLAIAPLDVVQLHGEESPELCGAVKRSLQVDVWKAFAAPQDGDGAAGMSAAERLEPYRGVVDAVLLDTAGGGTGRTFDWDKADEYAAACRSLGVPLYIAGGLHPDNVGELLSSHSPDGVDVSSGVETDGAKDIVKIRRFVERVEKG